MVDYNFWDKLMGTDENAGIYMLSYGEGPGADTRHTLSQFVNIGETVLDVGCGPGHNMEHFAEYGPRLERYKGVDYAIRFVRAANERRKQKGFPTSYALPFELQDCRDLKEPDKSWDVVILQDCLEHTNGFEKPIAEALRVARKRIIIAFWHLAEMDDPHINDDGDDGYGAWYDKREWEKFLTSKKLDWNHLDVTFNNHQRDFYIIEL